MVQVWPFESPAGTTTVTPFDPNNITIYEPQQPYNYQWSWYWPTEPQSCIGKAHVFECEHVNKCKCGAVERVLPRARKGKK